MTSTPFLTGFHNRRVRFTVYPVREDPIDEVITASSRSQKGGRCKLNCSANPNTPRTNRQCSLGLG